MGQRYWRSTSNGEAPPVLLLVIDLVGRIETRRGEAGQQLVADAATRRAGLVAGDPPAEATRIQQRRLLEPAGTDLDNPGEEQFVIDHPLHLERLAAHPGNAVAYDRQLTSLDRFEVLVGDVPELSAGVGEVLTD